MNVNIDQGSKRLNVVWEIIAGVAAILTLLVTVVMLRYSMSGTQEAYSWDTTFAVNESSAVINTQQAWAKGSVYYGVNQTSGTAKTTLYSIYYKVGSNAYKLEYASGYTSKNNVYYGAWYMHDTNGTSKYTYKLNKETNLSVASAMTVDLLLQ